MSYRNYSLTKFEGSSSGDKGHYHSSTEKNALNLSRDLMDNYQDTRNSSTKADLTVLNHVSRALVASPGHYSSKEHVPVHHFVAYNRAHKHNPYIADEAPLPTANLRAHVPGKCDYEPMNGTFLRNRWLSDMDVSAGNHYSANSSNRLYVPLHPKKSYVHLNSSTRKNDSYGLRTPERSSYHISRVLPDYGANDHSRDIRRRLERNELQHFDFPEPPVGAFSDMRQSLNEVRTKIDRHKRLLDRFAGIDKITNSSDRGHNIAESSKQTSSYRQRN